MQVAIPEPWLSFLGDIDRALRQPVEVHCFGGFVLAVLWALPRPTGDADFIEIQPSEAANEFLGVAGEGSELAGRYHLHFHRVTIVEYPEGYASRLIDIYQGRLGRLHLRAFEVHDLVLAKLGRNSPRDREDVAFLASKGVLDRRLLQERFDTELRPYALNEARLALSLSLWLDEFLGAVDA
jgi:uncharacterized nucleotidyltransferase DUF6036